MLAFTLAIRNLVGAGLRTWLTVSVLSLSFVAIVWHRAFLDGWNRNARSEMIAWDVAGGQYWHPAYDPYDPLALTDSHGPVPEQLIKSIMENNATPVLIAQGTIFPDGRLQSVLLKGIDPTQTLLSLPSSRLDTVIDEVPVMIGTRMAANARLDPGDLVTVRWRDAHGTFDAAEARIVTVFKTDVQTMDQGQLWLPLERLRTMMRLPGEATVITVRRENGPPVPVKGWVARDQNYLLADFDAMIRSKSMGGAVLYTVLLALALLAIFDTQVLSIFRRQKEIGTYMALGMTRIQVIGLFTVEGAMHGVLAALAGAVYGIPLLTWQANVGWTLPEAADRYGMSIGSTIYPAYSAELVFGTTLLVLLAATVVSYLPARKIATMKPTDAIRGRIQ